MSTKAISLPLAVDVLLDALDLAGDRHARVVHRGIELVLGPELRSKSMSRRTAG
jgi:hypothetical protein